VEGRRPDDEDPLSAPAGVADDVGTRGSIADGVKKALLAGVGALFMTEEGARRLARDWKLPKDVAAFIGQQAQTAKEEVLRLFADEIRRFLESDSVRREFLKAISEKTIEIRAEIRFRSDGTGAPRPEVSAAVKAKRGAKKEPR
jgi:HD-like signal output (HDOD) protein